MWETMRKKSISQYSLLKAGVDNKTLDAIKKGKNITLLTLEKICVVLDCTPDSVVRFVPDKE
jgi:DNA-binding Xre family transcriptional regulator